MMLYLALPKRQRSGRLGTLHVTRENACGSNQSCRVGSSSRPSAMRSGRIVAAPVLRSFAWVTEKGNPLRSAGSRSTASPQEHASGTRAACRLASPKPNERRSYGSGRSGSGRGRHRGRSGAAGIRLLHYPQPSRRRGTCLGHRRRRQPLPRQSASPTWPGDRDETRCPSYPGNGCWPGTGRPDSVSPRHRRPGTDASLERWYSTKDPHRCRASCCFARKTPCSRRSPP